MSQHWLTSDFLSKNSDVLRDFLPAKPASIESTQHITSQHVNTILAEDRLDYIVGTDGNLIKLVDSYKKAFTFKRRFLILGEGQRRELLPLENIIVQQDCIELLGRRHPGATLEIKDYVGICDKRKILEEKPEKGKGINYYSFTENDTKKYVIQKDVEESYADAEITSMSVMEVTAIPEEKMSIRFLGQYFSDMDMSSPEFYKYINYLLQKAILYLRVRAPILASHKEFKKISETSFLSESNIIDFLNLSQSLERRTSVSVCTLTKFMLLLHKFEQHQLYPFLERIYKDDVFLFGFLKDIFNLPDDTEMQKDERGVVTFKKTFPEYDNTEVIITARIKSLDSILQKSLADATYFNLDDLKDILGVTIYIPEPAKKHTFQILNQTDLDLLGGGGYIKNKGLLKKEDIPKDAPKKYEKAAQTIQRNDSSSANYDDVKSRGEHPLDFEDENGARYRGYLGTEIKVLRGSPEKDSNEVGMSFHLVFDYFSKHFEGERNRNPFLTAKNLSRLFDDFFPYLTKNISKYPSKTLWSLLQEIHNELPKENDIGSFPKISSPEGELKTFYDGKMRLRMFVYFAKKFQFQRATYEHEIVFTTKYNREQLKVGGRGYKYKS